MSKIFVVVGENKQVGDSRCLHATLCYSRAPIKKQASPKKKKKFFFKILVLLNFAHPFHKLFVCRPLGLKLKKISVDVKIVLRWSRVRRYLLKQKLFRNTSAKWLKIKNCLIPCDDNSFFKRCNKLLSAFKSTFEKTSQKEFVKCIKMRSWENGKVYLFTSTLA